MKTPHLLPLALALSALFAGCADDESAAASGGGAGGAGGAGEGGGGGDTYDWGLPPGVPKPKVPADNPMSADKVELGRRLFYDVRLSGNGTYSCASCHQQDKAFTDGLAHAVGSTGEIHRRSSMSVVNVGYLSALTWANSVIVELGAQALGPMFGTTPVELGLEGLEDEMLGRLRDEPLYQDLFPKAFPEEAEPVNLSTVTRAIAAFERSVLSFRSPYDRYAYGGDPTALSEAALRGRDLFFSETLECFHCHGGFNFSDSTLHEGSTIVEQMFHNTGLYNVGGTGAYPATDQGLFELTAMAGDMGRFRAPTLRNVELTGPYMHDGSVASLDEVLDHYAAGGRTLAEGPDAGVGADNPYKSELIAGFAITPAEKADVIEFLRSLTDQELLTDPRFSDPWKNP
jgi:cytochrome c peroxidase